MLVFPLCRIEEEELDKYSIPVKTESEKYKVIRTFSFLKSRMSSTRNKTKVEQNMLRKVFAVHVLVVESAGRVQSSEAELTRDLFSLWQRCNMQEMFLQSLKARVTDQTWSPASFLSMINPLF